MQQATWCDVSMRPLEWTLATCDVVAQCASFTTHSSSVIQCQLTPAPDHLPQLEASRWQQQIFTVVCLLMVNAYLLHRVVSQRRVSREAKSSRSIAVDAFRGLTICVMIFVNYGGGGFAMFLHSAWDGLTIADVVFPCFAWIMGLTMRISSAGRSPTHWRRIVERTAKLFLLGVFLNNGSSWATWRIPGVLQSLAAAYLLVSCLTRCVAWLAARQRSAPRSFLLMHVLVGISPLIVLSLTLTFGLTVPGCPRGYLGPGGDSDGGLYRHCTGGAHLYVDRLVFGESHIYQTPTCQTVFHTGPFDPEGLLNWLMVAVATYLGFLSGVVFFPASPSAKPFFVGNSVFLALAFILSSGLELVHWKSIPLNKNLWSLSYVFASVAVANLVFGLLLLLLDIDNHRTVNAWITPVLSSWSHVGRNSILIYVLHEILQAYAPFSTKPFAQQTFPVLLLTNSAGVLWWIFVAEWLHGLGVMVSL